MGDPIELELLHTHGDVCALFGYGDVTITVWHGHATEAAVLGVDEVSFKRAPRFPKGPSGVHLIKHGAGLPDAAARSALVASARKWAGKVASVAVVIEQAGFFGSAMRSAVTGIQLLSKAEFPMRVFASTRAAAEWLPTPHRERTGTVIDPARFDAAMQRARVLESAATATRSGSPLGGRRSL
jgi:hypothetical protein